MIVSEPFLGRSKISWAADTTDPPVVPADQMQSRLTTATTVVYDVVMAQTNRVVFMKYFILQLQYDAVVLYPGADRARTLEASTFGE